MSKSTLRVSVEPRGHCIVVDMPGRWLPMNVDGTAEIFVADDVVQDAPLREIERGQIEKEKQ